MELLYSMFSLWPILALASVVALFVFMLVRPSNSYYLSALDGTRRLDAEAVKSVAWKSVVFGLLIGSVVWWAVFLAIDLATIVALL